MKFILILMLYVPTTSTLVSVTTAEFDDLAACNAAYSAATKMTAGVGGKNSLTAECVAKSSGADARKK